MPTVGGSASGRPGWAVSGVGMLSHGPPHGTPPLWCAGAMGSSTRSGFGGSGSGVLDLRYPFTGSWLVRNSPANRVPSHGTRLFGSAYAIDFVPVDERGRGATFTVSSLVRPEPPGAFPGFGRAVLAPVSGTLAAVLDGEPDHASFRGLPSLGYAMTQRRRASRGWAGLAGNHVVIRVSADGPFVALCHLQRGSITVRRGQPIGAGEPLGRCGNSGNSTEPHLHVQAMDTIDERTAVGLPITFAHGLPRNGEIVAPA